MQTEYGRLAVYLAVCLVFPFIATSLAWIVRRKSPSKVKSETYECGMETIGDTWVQFKSRYYLYALIFVVFDVETVFLYPLAVVYNQLRLFAFVEMFVFIGILAAGLVYAWRKRALEWK